MLAVIRLSASPESADLECAIASRWPGMESKCDVPIEIHWPTIALRVLLTLAAGSILGVERSRTGHPAGLRTTLLVTLAASIAMIQMNLLLATNGKPSDSYAVMDLMRLPLGILTGVGFIGAGAIVRKNELVLGLTTAATLWFATVVGLCMGGGQLILGSVSAAIGFTVLWGFRYLEKHVERDRRITLKVIFEGDRLTPRELHDRLISYNFRIKSLTFANDKTKRHSRLDCELCWAPSAEDEMVPRAIAELERWPDVIQVKWTASSAGPT